MITRFLTILPLFFIYLNSYSQNVVQAEKAFPDADVVLSKSNVDVTFKALKDGRLVSLVKYYDSYVALKSDATASFAIFYDEYSDINKFNSDGLESDEFYNSNSIFHSDARVRYSNMKFAKYGVEKSASAEKQYYDMRYMSNLYIPKSEPCLERTITIDIPSDMNIDLMPFYLDENRVSYSKIKSKKGWKHIYKAKFVDAFDDSAGLPGHSYIYPHILILPKSYTVKGKTKNLFRNTNDQYAWYRTLVKSIGNDNSNLQSTVAKLIANTTSDREKMENIFYWVQDNIRYIAFEDGIAGFKPESCQNVFKKLYGDCKGMANLLKEMLLLAGFDARLCWIGTKSVAYDYTIPSLLVDNHMICAVKSNDEFIFLDGTEKFINIDNYAERIQNQEALIEDGDSYILKRVPKANPGDNQTIFTVDLLLDEKVLNGKIHATYTGEAKSSIRYKISSTKQNIIEETASDYLQYGNETVIVKDVTLSDFEQNSKQSKMEGSIEINEFVSTFGEETYVYMDHLKLYDNYDMPEDRRFEYWFDHKVKDAVKIKLNLGLNMKVSKLPEGINITNPEFIITGAYSQQGNVIEYNFLMEVPEAKISKNNLGKWNAAIKQLNEFYGQPIILSNK